MASHETRMAHESFGDQVEDLKPVVQSGSSDSASLDAVFGLMVRAGRELPMVKTMCIPEAWTNDGLMPQAWRDLSAYANPVMDPWDGPAAIAALAGRWVLGGMDRNGLRPMLHTVTRDGLLNAGSATAMLRVDVGDLAGQARLR